MLQGQRDLVTVGKMLLSELAPLVNAQHGTIYQMERRATPACGCSPATRAAASSPSAFALGEGLVGQCALEKQRILLDRVPQDYTRIQSSLGAATPANVVVLPVLFEDETRAVIELASLAPVHHDAPRRSSSSSRSRSASCSTRSKRRCARRTCCEQSQQLTTELQTRQTELQQTNEELASKAKQLAEQNVEVERKNMEVEQARRALEEKATELALTSKYKSEFLANMSHELRTPLNSILILGQQLADNSAGNLMPKQVEFARNIHSAGTDLLTLINDILDLSKIESGTVTVEAEDITFASLRDSVDRTFHHVAESKNLAFHVDIDAALPRSFTTDSKRLQQILKNLLSNAFKFTAQGHVAMTVRQVAEGWSADHPGAAARAERRGVRRHRHRHRHPARKAEAHLRGVPSGRRRHEPQVRRHRPGPGHQPRARDAARRRNPADERRRARQHVHAVPAAAYTGPARRRRQRAARRGPTSPRRPVLSTSAGEEPIVDDRDIDRRGDTHAAHRRRRSALRAHPARTGARQGLQGHRRRRAARPRSSLAREFRPTAITLDVFLPDMLGWTVLNNLKLDPATRHIPVQMLSVEEEQQHGLSHGAFSYLVKPATTGDLEEAFDRLKDYAAPQIAPAAGRRGQRHASGRASSNCWPTTTSRSSAWAPAPRR